MTWRLGRRPGLDGLRGVAILLVLLAHATSAPWLANAGSVGVTMFFGLSGFLITALLLDEREATGRISWSGFYKRRARRLFPVLAVYLAAMVVLTVARTPLAHVTASTVLPVVLYFENWVVALVGGQPASMQIAWSLSVEEQFYLVWPLMFVLARRWPRLPLVVGVVGLIAAPLLRLAMWDGGTGSWRIYYGSDTRMDSLLVGCLLAFAVKRHGVRERLRCCGLVGVVVLSVLLDAQSAPLHYLGEPLLASVGSALLIVGVLAGGSRWLGWAPLRWFGRRSYALYLWHYPFVWEASQGRFPMWAALVCSLMLAEATWWCVERPLSRRRVRPVPAEAVVVAA